jgi:hypothetical protein
MKISLNIGLVEVENCTILKTIFVTTFFVGCSVFSPFSESPIQVGLHKISCPR